MTLLVVCFAALLILLSSGIDTARHTTSAAEAIRLLKQLSTGMQGAAFDKQSGYYKMIGLGDLSMIQWKPDGAAKPPVQFLISKSGKPFEEAADAAYVCRVSITPSDAADPASYGFAHWRIAWPASAEWSRDRWLKAQGNDELIVMFRKR